MQNKFGIYPSSFQLLIDSLFKFKEIEKAIIFGSRAMGNYKEGSDIDLAVEGEYIDINTITKLSSFLNEELPIPYFIDVVDIKTINEPLLKEHIFKEGKVIFEQ